MPPVKDEGAERTCVHSPSILADPEAKCKTGKQVPLLLCMASNRDPPPMVEWVCVASPVAYHPWVQSVPQRQALGAAAAPITARSLAPVADNPV